MMPALLLIALFWLVPLASEDNQPPLLVRVLVVALVLAMYAPAFRVRMLAHPDYVKIWGAPWRDTQVFPRGSLRNITIRRSLFFYRVVFETSAPADTCGPVLSVLDTHEGTKVVSVTPMSLGMSPRELARVFSRYDAVGASNPPIQQTAG